MSSNCPSCVSIEDPLKRPWRTGSTAWFAGQVIRKPLGPRRVLPWETALADGPGLDGVGVLVVARHECLGLPAVASVDPEGKRPAHLRDQTSPAPQRLGKATAATTGPTRHTADRWGISLRTGGLIPVPALTIRGSAAPRSAASPPALLGGLPVTRRPAVSIWARRRGGPPRTRRRPRRGQSLLLTRTAPIGASPALSAPR